jgi:hypothetical protein
VRILETALSSHSRPSFCNAGHSPTGPAYGILSGASQASRAADEVIEYGTRTSDIGTFRTSIFQRTSALRRFCCKSLFVSPITNFPGCSCGDRILMWGTTSFCDELTGDFDGAFEVTSIDGCRLLCRLAEI